MYSMLCWHFYSVKRILSEKCFSLWGFFQLLRGLRLGRLRSERLSLKYTQMQVNDKELQKNKKHTRAIHIMCNIEIVPNLFSLCSTVMYAQISIQYNQCKLRYQKTSVVAQRPVTIFSEACMFHLPEFPLQECKILVSVYNTLMAQKPTKHLIGHLTVGREKNSEDQHWSLMMQSSGQ